LGRGRREFLFGKVVKGRLKIGFRRPLGWLGRAWVLKDRVRAYRTHPTDGFCRIAGRVCAQRHARGCRLLLAAPPNPAPNALTH
jgi:hypothetical protein